MALLQAVDNGILMSGVDRQDIVANRRLGELFSMTPQDIVENDPTANRRRLRSLLRDPQAFEARLEETYADPERAYSDELEVMTEPARILRRFTGPVARQDGEIFGRIWTFLDITETKRLQNELHAQLEARTREYAETTDVLRAMNEISRIAVLRLDTPMLLAKMVACVRLLAGQESAAILLLSSDGKRCEGMGAPIGAAEPVPLQLAVSRDRMLAQAVRDAPTTGGTLWREARGPLLRRLRCQTLVLIPLRVAEQAVGVLALGSRQGDDGIDRCRLTHLEAIADQIALALEVHRTQAELLQALEALKVSQRHVVEAEKLRTAGMLAATIAHDIRNILTTLLIELETMPETATGAISTQINRFAAMTHHLLAFARPRILETRPILLADVLRHIVGLVEGLAQVSNVTIQLHLPRRMPRIAADASQMENLFVNLCLNAIQAMSLKGGTLSLAAKSRKGWLEIRVVDTGCGIPSEMQERIFEPFFTTRATGSGLGLFSCRRIVEEHGGQLTVLSEAAKGTTFIVLFPTLIEAG